MNEHHIEPNVWPEKGQVYEITLVVAEDDRTLILDAPPEVWSRVGEAEGAYEEIGARPTGPGVFRLGVRYILEVHDTMDGPEVDDYFEAVWSRRLTVAEADR